LRNNSRVKIIDSSILSIEAKHNSDYIATSDRKSKEDRYLVARVEMSPEAIWVKCTVSSFTFYYEYSTIFKIIELLELGELNHEYKTVAI
jgi:hypothetical protein